METQVLTIRCVLVSLVVLHLLLSSTAPLHSFKFLSQACFLYLALLSFLRIFKVSTVSKFHQMARLAHLSLESTKSTFNGFTLSHLNFDLHHSIQFRGRGKRIFCLGVEGVIESPKMKQVSFFMKQRIPHQKVRKKSGNTQSRNVRFAAK